MKPHGPLMVNGLPRVAFLASRDIKPGEELVFDYGVDLERLLGIKDDVKKKKKKKKKKKSETKQACACNCSSIVRYLFHLFISLP